VIYVERDNYGPFALVPLWRSVVVAAPRWNLDHPLELDLMPAPYTQPVTLVSAAAPLYPIAAIQQGLEDVVTMQLSTGDDGRIVPTLIGRSRTIGQGGGLRFCRKLRSRTLRHGSLRIIRLFVRPLQFKRPIDTT
jgi:hypothetical protein